MMIISRRLDYAQEDPSQQHRYSVDLHETEDLDFADDISLLSHRQQYAQTKLSKLAEEEEKTGLKKADRRAENQQQAGTPNPTSRREHPGNRPLHTAAITRLPVLVEFRALASPAVDVSTGPPGRTNNSLDNV
ncbi:hypothetical protein C0Q70_10686 [Pomacea canaliculata]|uniref:Uncharacterized protein n=1 Tax=Pomacea canaliculata TaxID=400727 RepID=A0A2T7P3V7_POMCA|nr:hypothetical protein C0Q70_10686 [Pomacea canaliculata]